MKILFVCKYNAFRSRVAEEYFNKVNRNKRIQTFSRGIILGGDSDPQQRNISKRLLGVNIAKRKPIIMSIKDMKEADLIIVVANDVPKIIFNYSNAPIMKKVRIWKIRDEQKQNKKNINRIVLSIKRKVDKLAEKWKQ
jgi:protein-tyrosine-phosphatase